MGKDKKIENELKKLSNLEDEEKEEEKEKVKKIEKKNKQTPKFNFKNPFKKQIKKVPLTFNIGLAVILFLCYLSVMFVVSPLLLTSYSNILIFFYLVIASTLYILVKYIKQERELYDQKSS